MSDKLPLDYLRDRAEERSKWADRAALVVYLLVVIAIFGLMVWIKEW